MKFRTVNMPKPTVVLLLLVSVVAGARLWGGPQAPELGAPARKQEPSRPQQPPSQKQPENKAIVPEKTDTGKANTLQALEKAGHTAGAPVDPKTYVLGPEDVVQILVWGQPDFSRPVAIRPDGKITLPLVNEIQASGLTPSELAASVAEQLTKYLTHPEVTVSLSAVLSKKYFIAGEGAGRTGAFPLVVPTTVLDALIGSGGFREFARIKKIYILRGTKKFFFNYKDVINGKHLEQNIYLENNDKVVVP